MKLSSPGAEVTRLLSNLLKRSSIVNKDERVIDYNQKIREKVEALRNSSPAASGADNASVSAGGFVEGLNMPMVEQNADVKGSIPDSLAADGEAEQNIAAVDLEDIKKQADEMISEARLQAQQLIDGANDEAQQIREQARDEGYNSGMLQAQQQIEETRQQLVDEYNGRKADLQKEYDDLKAQMEPELTDAILEVFKNVTYAVSDDNKDIIINLVNRVLQDANISNDFVIKVSPDDYSFVAQNQGKLYCAMNKDIQVDIVEDSKLSKNQCIIEADSGVYDCSLDIQLSNLIREIKLLSCCG